MADNGRVLLRQESDRDGGSEERAEDAKVDADLTAVLPSEVVEEEENEAAPAPHLCCCGMRGNNRPLSVQSGDITRPNPPEGFSKDPLYSLVFPFILVFTKVLLFKVELRCFSRGRTCVLPIFATIIIVASLTIAAAAGLYSFVAYPPRINVNIKSFQIPNHVASQNWDGYQAASKGNVVGQDSTGNSVVGRAFDQEYIRRDIETKLKSRLSKRSDSVPTECPPSQDQQAFVHSSWLMDIVYLVRKGSSANLRDERHMRYLHDHIEDPIIRSEAYQSICHKASGICDPVNSLYSYFYPADSYGRYIYPTKGGLTPDINGTILNLLSTKRDEVYWFTGGQINPDLHVTLLRAQVLVGVPLPCYSVYSDHTDGQHSKATDFLLFLARTYLENASNSDIEVLYGGTDIFDYEVNAAKLHDIKLAAVSFVLILASLFVLTGFSPTAALCGLLTIISCFPLAFFIYRVILRIESIGLLNVISLFVIVGIGVDDVFVFLNTFKQSGQLPGLDSVHKRLAHTVIVAGKATFFTSITTTVAFLANAISQIPAVKQFGIFMGLVVFCCYVQVFVILPPFLQIWHYWFHPLEQFIMSPIIHALTSGSRTLFHCVRRRCGYPASPYVSLPSVRMTELAGDDDSGIVAGSADSGSLDSTGSGAGSGEGEGPSQSSSLESQLDSVGLISTMPDQRVDGGPAWDLPVAVVVRDGVEGSLSFLVQSIMLRFVARGVLFCKLLKGRHPGQRRLIRLAHKLLQLSSVWVFCAIFVTSCILIGFLKPTDHAPQFFDPNSNLQKMLDLTGNLTDGDSVNCFSCFQYNGGGTTPAGPTQHPPTERPPTPQTTRPPNTQSPTTQPPTTQPPTTQPPTTQPPTNPPPTNPPPTTQPPTNPPPTTQPSADTPTPPDTPPPTTPSPHPPVTLPPYIAPQQSGVHTNNEVVYAVFGIKGVERKNSPDHVLPTEGEGDLAILDQAFNTSFTCPRQPNTPSLTGTFNALCRLCRNITTEKNGLVLQKNADCFPQVVLGFFGCFGASVLDYYSECYGITFTSTSVTADFNISYNRGIATRSLNYLAMAFLSTTNINNSPFENKKDYQKWERFFAKEMSEIKQLSGPGQLYEGAETTLSSAFQTSGYWVELNTELVAIYGSIYGIIISFVLCSIVVVILSHNWRIVTAMFCTILGILAGLLGLFTMLGWSLGIVEAISLSILVGNSLDYCIHLSEGYLATDARHLAFLQRFEFTSRASIREKRVMAAIAFIGVSILSSAITTTLAIFPILFTEIQLFTRFGEILLLDTVIAIVYTLVFCASFLSFWGPTETKCSAWKTVNAVATILCTFAGYGVLFLFAYIMSAAGVDIPGPTGEPLFS